MNKSELQEHLKGLSAEIHKSLSPEAKASAEAFSAAMQAGEAMSYALSALESASKVGREYKPIHDQVEKIIEELATIVEAHHKVLTDRVVPDIKDLAMNYVKEKIIIHL